MSETRLESKMKLYVAEAKVETIKWMIGVGFTITGIIIAVFKVF